MMRPVPMAPPIAIWSRLGYHIEIRISPSQFAYSWVLDEDHVWSQFHILGRWRLLPACFHLCCCWRSNLLWHPCLLLPRFAHSTPFWSPTSLHISFELEKGTYSQGLCSSMSDCSSLYYCSDRPTKSVAQTFLHFHVSSISPWGQLITSNWHFLAPPRGNCCVMQEAEEQ